LLPLIRRAAQSLGRVPGFTALCIFTLAVGIGADTAVFSIVDAVLLRPLPYPRADRLVGIWHTIPRLNLEEAPLSDATYLLYRGHSAAGGGAGQGAGAGAGGRGAGAGGQGERHALADVAEYRDGLVNLTGGDSPQRVPAVHSSASLFRVLGVAPQLGRVFGEAEERPGAPPVVVLGDRMWRQQMGGDPAVLGRVLRIDGVASRVIGVMPPGFSFPELDTALWLPLTIDPLNAPLGQFNLTGVGRLAPGATRLGAQAELNELDRHLDRWIPDKDVKMLVDAGMAVEVRPLRDDLVGNVAAALWVFFGAVGCILVIAGANVANLLIVRGEGRQREMAIYGALGAGRGRVIGAVLAESLLIGIAAGVAGVALAWGGLHLLMRFRPTALARLAPASIDGRVVLFAALLAVLSSLLFGVVPAWRSSRQRDLAGELRGGGRSATAGRRRQRVRQLLVGVQLALAVVLLTGSGLMLRSFRHLVEANPGFDPAGVLTFELALPTVDYRDDLAVAQLYDRVLGRIAALPGVVAVGATSTLPLTSASAQGHLVEDFPLPDGAPPPVLETQIVTPDYLRAMGIPLIAGRGLQAMDAERRTGAVVVSAALAKHFWPHGSALGKRLRPGADSKLPDPWYTIVGVTGDLRQHDLAESEAQKILFYPVLAKAPNYWTARAMTIVVRVDPKTMAPAMVVPSVRAAVAAVARDLPLASVRTMEEVMHRSRARLEFSTLVVLIATAVALILGAVGLYGFVSYLVGQRTSEIGIRMALGADRHTVRWMIVREALVTGAAGLALGVLAAGMLSRSIGSLLFQVSPLDPLSFAAAPLLLLLTVVLASYLPADRAAQVEPQVAMRHME
jgi:predicted permease